jgi:hypothetical protein
MNFIFRIRKSLRNYKTVPVMEETDRLMDAIAVSEQQEELLLSIQILPAEDIVAGEGNTVCSFCQTNLANRVCSPCGHSVFCYSCALEFVRKPRFYQMITIDGEIEEINLRLPIVQGQIIWV